jgi:hypothetical protein
MQTSDWVLLPGKAHGAAFKNLLPSHFQTVSSSPNQVVPFCIEFVLYHYSNKGCSPWRRRMTDLSAVLAQLKKERDKLDRAIAALSQGARGGRRGSAGKRRLSAAARQRIANAQRARWAKFRAKKKAS